MPGLFLPRKFARTKDALFEEYAKKAILDE